MTDTHADPKKNDAAGSKADLAGRFRTWLRSVGFKSLLLFIAAGFLVLLIFFFVCTPKQYSLTEGAKAHQTILATRDVIDEVKTQERRDTAAAKVELVYKYRNVTQEVMSSLEAAFAELQTVQQYGESLRTEDQTHGNRFSEEQIETAIGLLGDTMQLDGDKVRILMRTNSDDYDKMVSNVMSAISNKLNMDKDNVKILQDQETVFIDDLLRDFGTYYPEIKAELRMNILPIVLKTCIQPNWLIDLEETEQLRTQAIDAVNPVIITQGDPIISEGDVITASQIEVLRTLKLLKEGTYDYSTYAGSAVAVFLSMVFLAMCLKLLNRNLLTDLRKLSVVLLIVVLCMVLAGISHLLPSPYIIPLSLGAILGSMLIGYRAGISIATTLSLLFSCLIAGNNRAAFHDVVFILAMTISESIVVIWFLKGRPQRVRVLIAGMLSAAAGSLIVLIIKLLTSNEAPDYLTIVAWTIAGGFLNGLLGVAFQPAFESSFRLATPSRLLEVTNPNQPLMKRLMIEAPGTYHHSIIVANLAEAAADKIGANPYLARAGAYYHDIGKLKRPGYFKENQNGDNPHERTDPYVSAAILTSHTKDGVLMAQKERMPVEIQDIIQQHHGVTPVMYFYHKALQMSNGSHVDIDEFRYAGPKPNTKEAAIVMLADTIEAAVRSMKDPTPKGIDQFIERLVRGKLEDGQLSNCPLSLTDIDQICEAFSGILKGVYHERIEYPTVRHYAGTPVPEQAASAPSVAPVAADTAQETTEAVAPVQHSSETPTPEASVSAAQVQLSAGTSTPETAESKPTVPEESPEIAEKEESDNEA